MYYVIVGPLVPENVQALAPVKSKKAINKNAERLGGIPQFT